MRLTEVDDGEPDPNLLKRESSGVADLGLKEAIRMPFLLILLCAPVSSTSGLVSGSYPWQDSHILLGSRERGRVPF